MKVSIVGCSSYDNELVYNAVKKAINDIDFEIKPNIKVLIKPNVLSQNTPDQHVTTHPSVVEAIIRIFKEHKCKVMIGESSGFYQEGGTNKALEISGIKAVSDKYNIPLINLETKPIKDINDENAVVYKNPKISSLIFDADLVVNAPKLKTHTLVKYTGAVKNLYGAIPGGIKQKLHVLAEKEEKFTQILVDIYQNIKPQLNIMDAIIGLEGNGPGSSGIPKKTGFIIASKNAPALDIVASEIIGYDPLNIFTNKYCIERKLVNPAEIEVIGDKRIINYKKPINVSKIPPWLIKWVSGLAIVTPYSIKKKCIKCGICRDVCPVGAIKLAPYPIIDKKKCISCYCCHENCPHSAMNLKGSPIFEALRTIKQTLFKTR